MTFLITRKSCRKINTCYSDTQLVELIPSEGFTPSQVAELTSISAYDKHWLLVYTSGATDRILREHACWCARKALALVENPDPRSIQAIGISERYARGEATEEELNIARKAADDAASAADANAATCTANATAWYAAASAADAARSAAAWYADAARSAAWCVANAVSVATNDATWEAQVKDLARRLTESNFLEKIEIKQVISRWKNLGV
jgi:hypothetical protein